MAQKEVTISFDDSVVEVTGEVVFDPTDKVLIIYGDGYQVTANWSNCLYYSAVDVPDVQNLDD